MGNIEEQIKKSISYFQSGYEDKYDEDEDQFEKDELVDIIGNLKKIIKSTGDRQDAQRCDLEVFLFNFIH